MNDIYSDPYKYNDPSVDLDKLARKVNENRKKMAKNVALDFNNDMNEINNGISRLENSPNKIYLPTSMTNNLPPTYGEFTNRNLSIPTFSDNSSKNTVFSESISYGSFSSLPESIVNSENSVNSSFNSSFNSDSNRDRESIFTDGISEMSLSVDSKLPLKVKSKLKQNKHLHNKDSDHDMISHINNCSTCRKELMSLLTNNENQNDKNINIENKNQTTKNINKLKQFNTSDIKDIIIILMIGIFIIILLDIFLKNQQ